MASDNHEWVKRTIPRSGYGPPDETGILEKQNRLQMSLKLYGKEF